MVELGTDSDAELMSDDGVESGDYFQVDEHDIDPHKQPNNILFDVTKLPEQLATTDGHDQEEVQAALYQQQSDSSSDYVTKFNTTPIQTVTLSKLCDLYRTKDVQKAIGLLRKRLRLVVDNEHLVQQDGPNVVPRIGPHFIDHILYVGSHRGLDAALPKLIADHNWQITLNLTNTYRLWPDSNTTCLPFNPLGRMMYIGIRLQEQLWLAMVPNMFFQRDHPANGREQFPILDAPTTALSQPHTLMLIMFIAFALEDMRFQDIHCIEHYPVPLNRTNVKESTEILGRDWENNRNIVLRLVDAKTLHMAFRTKCGAFDVESANWDNDRKYKHIRQFTFSLATHISYLDVEEWHIIPQENILNAHEVLYNKPDTDEAREQVDLHNLPLLDDDGCEINVYSEEGLRVPRRTPVLFSNCGKTMEEVPGICFTLIDDAMRPHLPDDYDDENDSIAGDGPNPHEENNRPRLGSAVLHAGKRHWKHRLNQCNVGLPHERFVDKVSGNNQPQALWFENTYTLDVHRLSNERQNGRTIYEHIITPLLKVWSHPTQIPSLFAWATYPLTTMIDTLWDDNRNSIKENAVLDPRVIEVMSMLERALNYAHTGNARVLCRQLMDRAWISLDSFIAHGSLVGGKTRRPLTSSRRSQELTYGTGQYKAYEAHFTIRHAINNFLGYKYSDIPDPSMRIACYAAEIAIRVYLEDVKHLVQENILRELKPILDGDRVHYLAKERNTTLSHWLDEEFPLSYSASVLPHLLRAVVNTNQGNANLELAESHLGCKPLSYLVDLIITQCRTPNSCCRPPFITSGNFLAVMRVAIDEMEGCATHTSIADSQTNFWVSEAIIHALVKLKVNHVPWCSPPAGQNGAPSSVVVHNVWLNLGGVIKPLTQPSSSFLTRQESLHMAALQTSEVIELGDPRGDWNALRVHLNKFSSVLHKTILPIEWDMNAASLANCPTYVIDTYNYVKNIFNPTISLHQLAIIVAIAFAGLTPNIFAPGMTKSDVPTDTNKLSAYVRGLEWVTRQNKKGATSQEPFITMVSTFVIAMSDPKSPISQRVQSGSDIKEWFTKHSAKGITTLALCRLGVAEPVTICALYSAKWGRDIRALSPSAILAKHAEVARPLPAQLPSHTITNMISRTASLSKRTLDLYWDDDSRISSGVDSEGGIKKRAKRSN
ncbi:hypothetical protein BDR07DRAFT_1381286 [Suillus spraguei]|nr:hypothetical protein BDR07DRAFT_1381286 [Suillus spraguei]